jgi:hypothetical protein
MVRSRYSVRVADSVSIAQDVTYDQLLTNIMAFTARAAIARSVDESSWEHDALCRRGLALFQVMRNGKAVWTDGASFASELAEAQRTGVEAQFEASNELAPDFFRRLDRALRARWRRAGYAAPALLTNMKKLFAELERDFRDRVSETKEGLIQQLLNA